MAHVTFQLGAAMIVPFEPPRRMTISAYRWRGRVRRAAAAEALNSKAAGRSLPRSPVWLHPPPTRALPASGWDIDGEV